MMAFYKCNVDENCTLFAMLYVFLCFMFQICCEFNRVVGKNLRENFFDALDHFSQSLMDLFRKKKGLTGQLLAELLHQTKVRWPLL